MISRQVNRLAGGRFVQLCVVAIGLAGCGGGDSGPQVSSLSAANARYAGTSTISVFGARLDEGISVSIEGPCENLVAVVGGSSDSKQFTCSVTEVGDFIATVARADGGVIGRLTVNVPRPRVEVTTNQGSFQLELDPQSAPRTVRNFLGYANANFYNNVLVHGAFPERGILTGSYSTNLRAKSPTGPVLAPESDNGLKNLRATVGMVGGLPASARAEWYVNTRDNADLDFVDASNPGLTVFGTVVGGMEVVDAITAVATRADATTGLTNVPVTAVLVTDVTQTR